MRTPNVTQLLLSTLLTTVCAAAGAQTVCIDMSGPQAALTDEQLAAARQRSGAASSRLPTCKCTLGPLPLHTGLKGVRVGKFAGKAVLAAVSMNA